MRNCWRSSTTTPATCSATTLGSTWPSGSARSGRSRTRGVGWTCRFGLRSRKGASGTQDTNVGPIVVIFVPFVVHTSADGDHASVPTASILVPANLGFDHLEPLV